MIYKKRLKEWLDQVYETVEKDISCRELRDRLPAYIDNAVQDQNPNGAYIPLQRHLDHCPECSEIFEETLHIAKLEASGNLPELEELLENIARPESAESEEKAVFSTPC